MIYIGRYQQTLRCTFWFGCFHLVGFRILTVAFIGYRFQMGLVFTDFGELKRFVQVKITWLALGFIGFEW